MYHRNLNNEQKDKKRCGVVALSESVLLRCSRRDVNEGDIISFRIVVFVRYILSIQLLYTFITFFFADIPGIQELAESGISRYEG